MDRSAVFFAGDSITFDTWYWGRLVNAAMSRNWKVSGAWARGGLTAGDLASMWPRFANNLPGVVVVAIGANDVMHGTSPQKFERAISRIVSLSPGRRIVFVGIYARSDPLLASRERGLNAILRDLSRSSKRIRFADWGGVMDREQTWSAEGDVFRIHLSLTGLQARAKFYVSALGRRPRS